jgi:hypothetical protein
MLASTPARWETLASSSQYLRVCTSTGGPLDV